MSSTPEERAERKRAYGRAYSKVYYAANRERALEQAKQSTWKPTAEQRRAYEKKYRDTHPDKRRAKDKRKREKHGERIRAQQATYHAANREKRNAGATRWYQKNQEKVRDYRLAKYGITHKNYLELLALQGYACRICGAAAENERDGRLHVDHDHSTTGQLRGLLCSRCNRALGGFRDDPKILQTALLYLEEGLHRMSSFTEADLRFGGRLTAAADALGAGHLRKAAAIFNELAEELNIEAETTTGLLSDEADLVPAPVITPSERDALQLATASAPADLQMCGRGVHSFGATDPTSGWRECTTCGQVNVSPPENQGAIDMSIRQ